MPDEGPVWSMRNLKPFEGRGTFYAKLVNQSVARAKKGISIDIPFFLQNFIFLHYFLFRLWWLT